MAHDFVIEDKWGDTLVVDFEVMKGGFEGKQYASFMVNRHGANVNLTIEDSRKLRARLEQFEVEAAIQEALDEKGE